MSTSHFRSLRGLISRRIRLPAARSLSITSATRSAAVPKTQDRTPPPPVKQAPNRAAVWAPSQRPRQEAMTGPRFEQTDFDLQPQPQSAMELIHKQPVRWTESRVVECDGGGGPAGHPRIFINTDKPEIANCNYCGLPFAHEKNRKYLESLPENSYPLS